MKTIYEFFNEKELSINKFKKWWIQRNKSEPDLYPLEIDDEGLWEEMLRTFEDEQLKITESAFEKAKRVDDYLDEFHC